MQLQYKFSHLLIGTLLLSTASCKKGTNATPLFENSIVSTEIDFITLDDPNTFESFQFIEQAQKEMPDSRSEQLIDPNAYIFNMTFSDGNSIEIWAHSDFGIQDSAEVYVQMVSGPLGRLPEVMRKDVDHVVLHSGDAGAFAESEGHFFMLYSDNMRTRVSNNDLEETVFHESVHASFQSAHLNTKAWKKAQRKDSGCPTEYAEEYPVREDMAESAIFAYTMIKHPGRLSQDIEDWMTTNIPNRIEFFRTIFE